MHPRDIGTWFGFAALPAAWPSTTAELAALCLACVATADIKRSLVLIAYGGPLLFGLPWPLSCYSTGIMWWCLERLSRTSHDHTGCHGTSQWRRKLSIASIVVVTIGVPSGYVASRQIQSDRFMIPFGRPSAVLLAISVVGAAVVNALGEEYVWREMLAHEFRRTGLATQYALQAVSFGIAHRHGLPSGFTGMILAGLYGGLMFAVRRKFGFLTTLVTHTCTDAYIFAVVVANSTFL